jgi:hypothetical protein
MDAMEATVRVVMDKRFTYASSIGITCVEGSFDIQNIRTERAPYI